MNHRNNSANEVRSTEWLTRSQVKMFLRALVHGRAEHIDVDQDGTITVLTTHGVEKIMPVSQWRTS